MHQKSHVPVSQANQSHTPHIVMLDTDIGDDIDDALALALLLKSPELSLSGITTVFGDTRRRAHLAAHLLTIFGRTDIPIAAGIGTPLQPRHRPSGVPQAALLDEREEFLHLPMLSKLSGPELIIKTAYEHYGQLTLLCIGPLTNIAVALQQEPQLFMAIRNIVVMGGTSGVPCAEWNTRSDARAAQIVLSAGIPITLIGLNTTARCRLQKHDLEQLRQQNTAQTQLLSKLIEVWQRHRPRGHAPLPYLHDPLVIAAACHTTFLHFEEMTIRILTHGPLKGYTIARLFDGPIVRAATAVNAQQARTWVMQRLLAPLPPSLHAQTS